MRAAAKSPILLVGPEADTRFLEEQLVSAGIDHPLLPFASPHDARDYLNAACIAEPLDSRFIPCLVLLDAAIPVEDRTDFTEWTRRQPSVATIKVALVTDQPSTHAMDGGADIEVPLMAKPEVWRNVVRRNCH